MYRHDPGSCAEGAARGKRTVFRDIGDKKNRPAIEPVGVIDFDGRRSMVASRPPEVAIRTRVLSGVACFALMPTAAPEWCAYHGVEELAYRTRLPSRLSKLRQIDNGLLQSKSKRTVITGAVSGKNLLCRGELRMISFVYRSPSIILNRIFAQS